MNERPTLTDAEMKKLFAAFDDVGASEELVESTLAALLASAGDEGASAVADGKMSGDALPVDAASDNAASADALPNKSADSLRMQGAAPETPSTFPDPDSADTERTKSNAADDSVSSTRDGFGNVSHARKSKPAMSALKRRVRAIRVLAIAACLALACVGGAAWALPAAHSTVKTPQGTVTLDVNLFGMTISAHADDEQAQSAIDGAGTCNRPYEDSLDIVFDTLGAPSDEQKSISIETNDDGMRERMERAGEEALERHQEELPASQAASTDRLSQPNSNGGMAENADTGRGDDTRSAAAPYPTDTLNTPDSAADPNAPSTSNAPNGSKSAKSQKDPEASTATEASGATDRSDASKASGASRASDAPKENPQGEGGQVQTSERGQPQRESPTAEGFDGNAKEAPERNSNQAPNDNSRKERPK